MNLIMGRLRSEGWRTSTWFNAWHHQQEDHLLASLIETITISGLPPFWTRGLSRLPLPALLVSDSPTPCFLGFFLGNGFFAGGIDRNRQLAVVRVVAQRFRRMAGSAIEARELRLFAGAIAMLMAAYALRLALKVKFIDPVQLVSAVRSRLAINQFRNGLSFRHRFAQEFRDITDALAPVYPVILIYDLDRCRPEHVLDVPEAVNFLVSSGNCYVVLGMDRTGLSTASVIASKTLRN